VVAASRAVLRGISPDYAPALLTAVAGQADLFRVYIDRELPLKDAMKIIGALPEVDFTK